MTEEAAMTEIPVGEDVRDYIDAIPAAISDEEFLGLFRGALAGELAG